MKTRLLLALIFLGAGWPLYGQLHFNGRWEGHLTDGDATIPIEILLKREGRNIHGQTFIQVSDTLTLEMKVDGIWHEDQSFNLFEMEVLWPEDVAHMGFIRRTYQILYKRSFNDASMKGWWQERGKVFNDQTRRAGRIELRPIRPDKA